MMSIESNFGQKKWVTNNFNASSCAQSFQRLKPHSNLKFWRIIFGSYFRDFMLRETRDMYITICENIIGAPKIRINFCALILFTSNIGLFSISPCKVIALYLLCLFFNKSSFLESERCRSFSFVERTNIIFAYCTFTHIATVKTLQIS